MSSLKPMIDATISGVRLVKRLADSPTGKALIGAAMIAANRNKPNNQHAVQHGMKQIAEAISDEIRRQRR